MHAGASNSTQATVGMPYGTAAARAHHCSRDAAANATTLNSPLISHCSEAAARYVNRCSPAAEHSPQHGLARQTVARPAACQGVPADHCRGAPRDPTAGHWQPWAQLLAPSCCHCYRCCRGYGCCSVRPRQVPLQLIPAAGEHFNVACTHHLLVLYCCCLRVLGCGELNQGNTGGAAIVCDDVHTAGTQQDAAPEAGRGTGNDQQHEAQHRSK